MNASCCTPEPHPFTRITAILFLLTLLSTSCAGGTPASPTLSEEEIVNLIVQTSVAFTLTAQVAVPPTLTATPIPSATPALIPTATLVTPASTPWIVYVPYTYSPCEDSDFLRDVSIPDGTVLTPGQHFTKTWRFKNNGTCAWDNDYKLVFLRGRRMHGADTEIAETIRVDGKLDVSVDMVAPSEPGDYSAYWQLADLNGDTFGDIVYVEIVVVKPTVTVTPTATLTFTPTLTQTPSLTPTSTSTETPSLTPSLTLSPTDTVEPTPTSTCTPTEVTVTPSPTEDDSGDD